MSEYSVGEREAVAWNVQLDLQWGKTGLIVSVVLCTLVGCQQPTAACPGLHKNNLPEACIRREGRSCCMKWSNLTFHLWIASPSAKKTLLLTAEASAEFFHFTCSRASLKHFLPWVLCCPSSLASLAGSKLILKKALKPSFSWKELWMLLSPPVLLFSQPCLAAVPPSPGWAVEAAAGTGRTSVQRVFAVPALFVFSLVLMQCFDTTGCC